MLRKSLWSAVLMAEIMLITLLASYLTLSKRFPSDAQSGLSRSVSFLPSVPFFLGLLAFAVFSIGPALWIYSRDESHFGISGALRWAFHGIVMGLAAFIAYGLLPARSLDLPLLADFVYFLVRIILGICIFWASYWVIFLLPGKVSAVWRETDQLPD